MHIACVRTGVCVGKSVQLSLCFGSGKQAEPTFYSDCGWLIPRSIVLLLTLYRLYIYQQQLPSAVKVDVARFSETLVSANKSTSL